MIGPLGKQMTSGEMQACILFMRATKGRGRELSKAQMTGLIKSMTPEEFEVALRDYGPTVEAIDDGYARLVSSRPAKRRKPWKGARR